MAAGVTLEDARAYFLGQEFVDEDPETGTETRRVAVQVEIPTVCPETQTPNAYEAKREARIERLRNASQRAAARSNLHLREASAMQRVIPFGQPILVGHHSERGDRAFRGRIDSKFASGFRESEKAQRLAERADAAENNTAISSDDPAALEKLLARVATLEEKQTRMKAVNAFFRKNKTCVGCPGISDETARKLDASIEAAYSWNKQPFPSFELTNNNANIKRIKERIAILQKRKETDFQGWKFDGGEVVANKEDNRLQILFDSKPDVDLRSKLKSRGFRWSPTAGAWQRQLNHGAIYAAQEVIGGAQ